MKDKIVVENTKRLGGLDQVVSLQVAPELVEHLTLDDAARSMFTLVDGESSVGDLVRAAVLEVHVALSALVALDRLRLVRLREPRFSLPEGAAPVEVADQVKGLYSDEGAPVAEETADADVPRKSFDELFQQAALAYMQQDVDAALDFYKQCLALRPRTTGSSTTSRG